MLAVADDDVPGGKGYLDVTSILVEYASEIAPGGMLAMKNFTLHDAMMAIEVMDPRMDSGVARPEYPNGNFDPYALLLPEEVCWIIDRTFAAEMSWHSGQSLSQSVFTCLYVHEVVPGRMWNGNRSGFGPIMLGEDPQRPVQLLSLVLRAAIYGLLKSCDFAWRELTKGHVIEMEDFNGEKSDRFMCETLSDLEILGMLDAARLWLLSKQAASISMRAELIARIELRRAILTILSPLAEVPNLQATLRLAQSHLKDIQTFKTPSEPNETSPAYHAFDPAISRRLLSVMPLKITPLPEQTTVWKDYFLFLSGIQEVCLLTKCPLILQIKELLELRAYQPPLANRIGLVRSFANTALMVAKGEFWAEQLFEAMANVSLTAVLTSMPVVIVQQAPAMLKASVEKMTQQYFSSFFSNRPRQRRKLCNWMSDWATLPDQLQDLMTFGSMDAAKHRACHRLFLAVSILRFTAASHIILAGLELDIHDPNELAFVFWHGAVVYNTLNDALKALRKVCEQASPIILDYLFYEMMWSSLMGQYFMACCTTSLLLNRTPEPEPRREETNFRRRFKWAFGAVDSESDPCTPRFEDWRVFRDQQRGEDVGGRVKTACEVFVKLEESLSAYEEVVRAEQVVAAEGRASPTVLEQSARLRLEILQEMKESACCNWRRLGVEGELPIFSKLGGGSRWFPTVC